MRKRLAWLASVSALTAAILIGPPALAKRNANEVQIGSFTGAYLAARVAEVDDDMDAAIDYYRRALDFDPDNQQLQQSLMLVLISSGRFEEALPLADRLKTVPEVERFSRVALAVDAIRKKDYREAGTWLKLALESDLDRLITGLMSAWTKLGRNDGAEAVADLESLDGPEWFELFSTYHSALIAEMAGLPDRCRKRLPGDARQCRGRKCRAGNMAARRRGLFGLSGAPRCQGRGARRPRQGGPVRDRPAVAGGVAREDQQGRKAGIVRRDSGGWRERSAARSRRRAEPRRRRAFREALSAACACLEAEQRCRPAAARRRCRAENDSEEAISFYEKIPAASPLKRAADLQLGAEPRRSEAARRGGRVISSVCWTPTPTTCAPIWRLAASMPPRRTTSRRRPIYDRAVEHLKEPTSANWNIFYQRGIAYERLKQWPKAEAELPQGAGTLSRTSRR